MRDRSVALLAAFGGLIAAATWVACGGGGGGGGSDGARTTIQGNVADSTAFLLPAKPENRALAWLAAWSPVGIAWAQATGAEVCIVGTDVCTTTDANGAFVVTVDGGLTNPCLDITAQDFSARVCLDGAFPAGSVISVQDIHCSTGNGTCVVDDVDVSEPSDASEPSEPSIEDVSDPSEPSVSTDVDDPSDADEVSGPDDDEDEDVSPDDD